MNTARIFHDDFAPTEVCNIVIIYEDVSTRQRALSACDYLARQFWSDLEFSFHWWRADFLVDAELAARAAETALIADFLILALGADTQMATTVKSWFASWSGRRKTGSGALVDLTDVRSARTGLTWQRKIELSQIAQQAGLDYLTCMPATMAGDMIGRAAGTRPDQTSTVLNEILTHSPPPPHFGLND